MHDCISESAIVDDLHADPYIDVAEDALLAFFVFAGMIEEDTVEKLIRVYLSDGGELNGSLTVAAESGFLLGVSSGEH